MPRLSPPAASALRASATALEIAIEPAPSAAGAFGANVNKLRKLVSTPSKISFSARFDAAVEHGVAQAIRAHAARPGTKSAAATDRRRQRQQLRHALALVHAARFAGDLVVGAAEHRIELRAAREDQ